MSQAAEPLPMEISCQEVKSKFDSGESFVLLDCRELDEYQTAHIPQATFLPMSEIQSRIAELNAHRESNLVVHCHHGGRSLKVAAWLRQQGFQKAQSMRGGIDQWSTDIDRTIPRY